MSDNDTELSPEELAAIQKAWREFVEDKAHGAKLHYSPVKVHGTPLPGSFRLPKDVVNKLGENDPRTGGAVVHAMFGVEDHPEDLTVVHPDVVRIIGHGSLAKGRRVLEKFVAMLRRQSREGVVLEHDGLQHDDGHHGWRVAR